MAGELVLITGANGHAGFRVVVSALHAGYRVRIAVRRQAAADQIKTAKSTQGFVKNIEVVLVPDLLAEGAYDEAVKGVDYVIHLASPITTDGSDEYYETYIKPATQGTVGILRSALKVLSIRRVVITSSVVVLNFEAGGSVKEKELGPVPDPHKSFDSVWSAYVASKRIALSETNKFIKEHKPSFDVVNILPSLIFGKHELITKKEGFRTGSNRYVIELVDGIDAPAPRVPSSVHVDDVGLLHVLALDSKIPGNSNFIASGTVTDWPQVTKIIEKNFAGEAKELKWPLNGKAVGNNVSFDASETERVFGIKFIGLEEQLNSLAAHYAEVSRGESV